MPPQQRMDAGRLALLCLSHAPRSVKGLGQLQHETRVEGLCAMASRVCWARTEAV